MFMNCDLGMTLESPLDCKEIQSVHPKIIQSCIFIGRTDVEAETLSDPIDGSPPGSAVPGRFTIGRGLPEAGSINMCKVKS